MANRYRGSGDQITANKVIDLLAAKHRDDVFIPECKDGPSSGTRHKRLDALAIPRSWSNLTMVGYEVKVSRGDFLQDTKWPGYLEMCNELSFVCPHGLIQPQELPDNVGLLWVSKTGTRLFTKRKAARRDIDVPVFTLFYILICRARITRDRTEYNTSGAREFWEEWLKEKALDWSFGRHVGKAIRERVESAIDSVQHENQRLKRQNEELQEVADFMKTLGISPGRWDAKEHLKALKEGIPKEIDDALKQLERSITDYRKRSNKMTEGTS